MPDEDAIATEPTIDAYARAIVETVGAPLLVLDSELTVVAANPAFLQAYGLSGDAVVGGALTEIDDRRWAVPQLLDLLRRVLPEHEEVRDLPLRVSLGDRGTRDLVLNARQVMLESLKRNEILLSFMDVTERETARRRQEVYARELERSNRDLQDFAHAASHDLQEPLRKIRAYVDHIASALDRSSLDERTQRYLERLPQAAARLQRRIDDLLQLARVGRAELNRAETNLDVVVRSVLEDLEVPLRDTGAEVDVGPLPTIWSDAAQMRLLFQNLLSNAIKFRRADVAPRVRITAERPEGGKGGHRIVVEDNGIGFEQEHAERIFGAFQRLHGRDAYEGSGVGLAICRRITERHGGTIEAEGRPGDGASFSITLPERKTREQEIA